MSALLIISLSLVVAVVLAALAALVIRRRREEAIPSELLLRNLAQARMRAQIDWAIREMIRITAESAPRQGDEQVSHREVSRR